MIVSANKNDNVLPLFERCFSIDLDFNNYFFNNVYCPDNTLLYKVDNNIVAMLQMIYYEANQGRTMYLFGVCTDEMYRKQGLSTLLLNRSFEIAKEKGCNSVILIPEKDWLFNFYSKLGFKSSFLCEKNTVFTSAKNNVVVEKMSYQDINDAINLYNNSMICDFYIKRDYNFYKQQIDLYCELAVKYICDSKAIGYSFGTKSGNSLILDEIIAMDYDLCIKAYNHCKITYIKPGIKDKLGMIKPLNDEDPKTGYINLMFN